MPDNDTPIAPSNGSAATSLVDIKNKKLVFRQKPITLDKLSETMQEIVKFRDMLSHMLENKSQPMKELLDDHLPVIAKLVHESDKTGATLVKHVQKQLVPADDTMGDGNPASPSPAMTLLPPSVIEAAITTVATRVNYGLDNPLTGGRVPAAFCVWRWEVKPERRDWLPKSVKDKVEARILERTQAKKDLAALFDTLPQDTKDEILKNKTASKQPLQGRDNDASPSVATVIPDSPVLKGTPSPVKTSLKRASEDDENAADGTPDSPTKHRGRPKNPETIQKEKERQERKAAKEEKERKAHEAASKARNLMSNFFAKPKAGPSTARARSSSPVVSRRSPSEAQAKEVETEYSKTFRPFVIKKGADVAPINWFLDKGRSKGKAKEVIDLVADDDGDVVLVQEKVPATDDSQTQDLANLSDRERLQQLLALMPPALAGSSHQTSGDSVRSIISLMSDAEVNGDIALVRMYHDRLADRTALPAKVFIFAEDTRPGYFGTHTKTSTIIKPRAPLNRDTAILDYTYDSDEEWEGEEEGGGDDVADDDEEGGDAAANDDDDSDADSWLVDDDEVDNATLPDLDRMSPVSDISLGGMSIDRARSPVLSRGRSPVLTLKKRKSMTTEEKPKGEKKRRVVVPLVPYIKGPHWESEVGTCEYAPFESFRIQLFNDTPYGVDPFTFVSTVVEDAKAAKQAAAVPDGAFAIPAIPDHVLDGSRPVPTSTSSPPTADDPAKPRGGPKPKSTFPEALVPTLLAKIRELSTGSFVLIVEAVYQDLKAQKVKKNSLEAKIREVSEKTGSPKVWTVKPDVLAQYT